MFDNKNEVIKKNLHPEMAYPIKFDHNPAKHELFVCTRKDIRILRLKDGRFSHIF